MRTRLRILKADEKYPVYGVTIPKEISVFFEHCEFVIETDLQHKRIILTSGCTTIPTKEQIKNYHFEDVKV